MKIFWLKNWAIPVYLLLAVGWAAGCSAFEDSEKKDDPKLAVVFNKTLFLSDLEGMVPTGTSADDSILIVRAFVDRWVREAVLLNEAELNIPKDFNVDKLVRDYRASLIKTNYEQILVGQLLDSVVSGTELKEFYEKYKDQFQLNQPILRCYFMKVPKGAPDLKNLRSLWSNISKAGNIEALKSYCTTLEGMCKLEESTWYDAGIIAEVMPLGWLTSDNVGKKEAFVQSDDFFIYFFKPLEVIAAKELPPYNYVEDKARRLILHQRKQKLLERKKEEMYEREMRRNNIQVY
jgi:hypothetical protein